MKQKYLLLNIILFVFLFLFSAPSLALIPGDFGSAGGGPPDGVVDFEDLMIFAMAYGSTPIDANWNEVCDIYPDDVIDFEDLMIFAMHYGEFLVHNITKDTYYKIIQNALYDAQDRDIIEVGEGEFSESIQFPIGKAIILRNAIGVTPKLISLADNTTVRFCDGCLEGTILEGFTITHNLGEAGRGIDSDNCNITINNCTISGNSYRAISTGNSSTMTLNGCIISSNSNGGMSNGSNCNMTINNCTISDNSTDYYGAGGGMLNYGVMTINECNICDNSAGFGCIYNSGTMNINDCTITNNFAGHEAGAIYNTIGTMAINNCTISDNFASKNGAIVNYHATLIINGGAISNNSTDLDGGGIYNYTATLTVEDCTISSNSAGWGGGIFNYYEEEGDLLTIKGCSITSNISTQGPYFAGIYLHGLASDETVIIGGNEETDKNNICSNYVTGNPPTLNDQIGNGTASLYDLYKDTNNIYDICH